MGKHFLTRLAEAEKLANQVIAATVSDRAQPRYRSFYRGPEFQAALTILLKRKFAITPGTMYALLRYPMKVRTLSMIAGGAYPRELRDAKNLRSLADQVWDLAFELDGIEVLHDIAQHAEGKFADKVKAKLPPRITTDPSHISDLLRGVSQVLEELAQIGPPVPKVYSKITPGRGKQPNPYVDTFVYSLTRVFRKTFRAPLYQVTAHLLNGAMDLPEEKKFTGRKVFEIYRRLHKHARRKKRLKLV